MLLGIPLDLQTFVEAFKENGAGAVRDCQCGKTFYNPDTTGWDWEPGELEKLEANSNATGIEWAVSYVIFEGRHYVLDCECWRARARELIKWITRHDRQIADFLTAEKKRKTDEAERSPVVK